MNLRPRLCVECEHLKSLLKRVEWVEIQGEEFCAFCDTAKGEKHMYGCEWVKAVK